MIRNGIPVRTLKLDSGVDIMLGEGSSVVGMKRGVAAEDSVDDDGCEDRIMSLCSVCIWKQSYLSTRRRWLSL